MISLAKFVSNGGVRYAGDLVEISTWLAAVEAVTVVTANATTQILWLVRL